MAKPTGISWYNEYWAENISGATDGAAVETWTDNSGNSRVVSQPTAGARPIYRASVAALNGQSAVEFDGVDDWLRRTDSDRTQPLSFVAIFNNDAAKEASSTIFSDNYASTGTQVVGIYGATHGTPDFVWTTVASPPLIADTETSGQTQIVIVTWNGASSEIRINGTVVASGTTGSGALQGGLVVGAGNTSGTISSFFKGHLAYAATKNGTLTLTEKQDLEAWFAEHYVSSDSTAPTLTSPGFSSVTSTTATGSVTTDEANGTLYAVVTTSATAPSVAQIQAGQDHTGAAAAYAANQAITTTGAKTFNATGLTASTAYYWHFQHRDAATNDSTVVSTTVFNTTSGVVRGVVRRLFLDGLPMGGLTGIRAMWWDSTTPSGAPAYETTTATTDADGWISLNIESATSLSVGASGVLMLYKIDGTDHRDSLMFVGRLVVSDIS